MFLVEKDDLAKLIFYKPRFSVAYLSKKTAVEKAEEGMDDYRSP
jgi:hypothetical protein